MNTFCIHGINQIRVEEVSALNARTWSQRLVITGREGVTTDLTLFYDTESAAVAIGGDAALARAAADKERRTGSIARVAYMLKDSKTVSRLDGHLAPFETFAQRFANLANDIFSEATAAAACRCRSDLRAIRDELDIWVAVNEAEISLTNALISAFYLFTTSMDSRFENAYTAFWEGHGWASALAD